jgi:predicted RNase H-like nuclease
LTTILAIDAAWTNSEPSGVALVKSDNSGWRCIAAVPSYNAFIALSQGIQVQWGAGSFNGTPPNVAQLLQSAQQLAGTHIDLVAIDIPVATVPLAGRRAADQSISMVFGSRGCSTHSPTQLRPGRLGRNLLRDLIAAGYPLSTTTTPPGSLQHTVEVYPHPALLTLLHRNYRVPYKVSKSKRYWPQQLIIQRIQNLLCEFVVIEAGLANIFGHTGIPLPSPSSTTSLASLKRYEDALDALVCAWVGTQYVSGTIVPYGDSTAAIWTP